MAGQASAARPRIRERSQPEPLADCRFPVRLGGGSGREAPTCTCWVARLSGVKGETSEAQLGALDQITSANLSCRCIGVATKGDKGRVYSCVSGVIPDRC
jgi:hypothetical protein